MFAGYIDSCRSLIYGQIVTLDSAGLNNQPAQGVDGVDHKTIAKYPRDTDAGYVQVVDRLEYIKGRLESSEPSSTRATVVEGPSKAPSPPRPASSCLPGAVRGGRARGGNARGIIGRGGHARAGGASVSGGRNDSAFGGDAWGGDAEGDDAYGGDAYGGDARSS